MPEALYQHNNPGICLTCFNEPKVSRLKAALSQKDLKDDADINKIPGHRKRLEILFVISSDEVCVCDLTHILDIPISTLSQHLKKMRDIGLIKSRMDGKFLLYSLTENGYKHLPPSAL